MSHKATYWLSQLDPSRIKAGEFRVLFHLCDFHNDSKTPNTACFPTQKTLRERAGLSNAGLNSILNRLEEGGLIRRIKTTVDGSAHRRTFYVLGCDFEAETAPDDELTPESGVGEGEKLTPFSEVANSTFEGSKLHPKGEYPVRNCKGTPPKPPKGGRRREVQFGISDELRKRLMQ